MSKPVAIITGAAGGMGIATAMLFADEYQLVLSDISQERLDALEKLLLQKGVAVSTLKGDVSNSSDIQQLVNLASKNGEIKALVHTAGLSPTMDKAGDRIIEVNLIGTDLLLNALAPHMQNGAAAVCVASQAGTFMEPQSSPELNALLEEPMQPDFISKLKGHGDEEWFSQYAYSLSKLGVQLLVRKYAGVWGKNNARLISLSPGAIDTPMGQQESAHQPMMAELINVSPLGRMGQPDEIAKVAKFLCSADASLITGTDLLVDGGSTFAAMSNFFE